MRGLLKNKRILHLGVEKGLIFFNGWKDILKLWFPNRAKSQPYILVRGFLKKLSIGGWKNTDFLTGI